MKMRAFIYTSIVFLCGLTAAAAESTWTGRITDSMCDKDHSMMASGGKQPDARECTLECVKAGSKYVFVSGGKVYAIANQDLADLQTYAGKSVKLVGQLESDGKTIKAEKLQPAK